MYVVTRQQQWATGDSVVEISVGGLDYTNPDALCGKYPGEFREFVSPVEAVEAAIGIARAWRKDAPALDIQIAAGCTMGMTMPFAGEPLTDETFDGLRQWARKIEDSLPHCDECGEPIRTQEHWTLSDYSDLEFCREYCADQYSWREREELEAELAAEQEDE
ncbi:MAG TPA: hypothetical protein VLM89_07820 [Phycisphaerae bacterium]|nr:hypothetical protein [Phycisphaerae bacterium]